MKSYYLISGIFEHETLYYQGDYNNLIIEVIILTI